MSFVAQEQALFDLLFDEDFLEEFLQDKTSALELYGLTAEEIADFSVIRTDSLKLEAKMRKNMLLGQMVKHLPLSFVLLSSFDNGFDICRGIIKPYLVQMNGFERLAVFSKQLLLHAEEMSFFHERDRLFVEQLISLESQMVQQAAKLECEQSNKTQQPGLSGALLEPELTWAENVTVHSLPVGFAQLKAQLCGGLTAGELWQKLQSEPLTIENRMELILNAQTKLLITQPVISCQSATDRNITFKTIELIDGFEPLIKSINGRNSLDEILQLYNDAGAESSVLEQVADGVKVLYEQGFII